MGDLNQKNLLDDAMLQVGGNDWSMSSMAAPSLKVIESDPQSLTFTDLAREALRGVESVKTVSVLVDFIENVNADINVQQIVTSLGDRKYEELPAPLRPRVALPPGAKMQFVFQTSESGSYSVVRSIWFSKPLQQRQAAALAGDRAYVPVWRAGPWAWKKAVQHLLERIPGKHVQWNCLQKKGFEPGERSKWNPTAEELQAGVEFINKACPAGNSQNEQLLWILTQIKANDGNPIAGWPEKTVTKAAVNKSTANSAADPETFFPLNIYDLKPLWSDVLLPRLLPLFTEFGLLALGWPGVGKTPLAIVLSMALGRYHCQRSEDLGPPGWRRGKMMDNFRNRPGQIQEAAILDDATISFLDCSDIKHFLDVGETTTAQSRYSPAKFMRNQFRAICDNEFNEGDEPDPDMRSTITFDEFYKMTSAAFKHAKKPHVMAILKRCVAVLAGKHALYVRLPSQSDDSPVLRFAQDRIAEDWLLDPGNKTYYNDYKRGKESLYPGFADNVAQEQAMIQRAMQKMEGMRAQEYVSEVNQELLQVAAMPPGGFRFIPATPASQAISAAEVPLDADGGYSFPAPHVPIGGATVRSQFSSDFSIRKRLRAKSPALERGGAGSSSCSRGVAPVGLVQVADQRGIGQGSPFESALTSLIDLRGPSPSAAPVAASLGELNEAPVAPNRSPSTPSRATADLFDNPDAEDPSELL